MPRNFQTKQQSWCEQLRVRNQPGSGPEGCQTSQHLSRDASTNKILLPLPVSYSYNNHDNFKNKCFLTSN